LRKLLAIVVIAGLAIWGVIDHGRQEKSSAMNMKSEEFLENEGKIGINKGNTAPDFELESLSGEKFKLSDYRGKKVIVNFWATWCPPCRMEMPHMQKYYEQFQNKDVVIFAVNLTHTEKNRESVARFVEQYSLTFPVLMDEEGAVSDLYGVMVYPTTYIIGSNGMIREKIFGAVDYDTLKKLMAGIDENLN